ncbi:class I SAM-dependent methyltransferase [Cryobacterium fucosi]|uniref:Methyltransferase domain-containing protein n=1 Tax=Cryobacterium fucosi TaxID=1259157 RepID=A0A4R9BGN9_9MICO|nr:class I SAM-dependent methyltransferase [Cryobacterium fucosi]TFD83989.1 methyltransferase domain-containing protein [Cryobacterium fucosi]
MDPEPVLERWEQGSPYERYIGRWSRLVAPEFLDWLGIPPGRRWLDVGCGTGVLCQEILGRSSPAEVIGVEPSAGFLAAARENLAGRARLYEGSAEAIPLAGQAVDVAVSGLVLNFIPDQRAALAEMARVTVEGGTIGAYVWDYAGKMELIRYFWDAAALLDPDAVSLHEGSRFPSCRPDALGELFTEAGLADPEVRAIDIPTPFSGFDDYWEPFLGGQGAAPAYLMSLGEQRRAYLREILQARLPTQPDGSVPLSARAWAARATVRA